MEFRPRILHSTDAGATWKAALAGNAGGIQNLVYDSRVPNTLFMLTVERDTLNLFRSGDNVSTFAELSALPYSSNWPTLPIDPRDSRLMYLSPSPYLSRNSGVTWTTTSFKLSNLSLSHFRFGSSWSCLIRTARAYPIR